MLSNKRPYPFSLLLCAALCLLALALPAHAQQPSRPSAPAQADDVLRITTELVQTDVMVFDRQGRFVEGLLPEQFELQVNGQTQAVSFFERVTAGSLREAAQLAAAGRGSASGIVNPKQPAEIETTERGRLIFFFVDDLHLSGASLVRARQGLQRFVDNQMNPLDQVAIVSSSGQIGFLQQLTDNQTVLHAAIKRLGYRQNTEAYTGKTQISEYQASQIAEYANSELFAYLMESVKMEQQMGSGNRRGDHKLASTYSASPMLRNRIRQVNTQGRMTTSDTLNALHSLMLSSAALPGRKLVFFLSDGFIVNERKAGALEMLHDVTQAAARAGAVVYTMDMRGTFFNLGSSVDASTNDFPDLSSRKAGLLFGEISATQEPLQLIADETGGRAILNSNAIDDRILEAIRETSNYYLLAWRPTSAEQRDARARLKVVVKGRPDLRVRLRTSYASAPSVETKPSDKTNQPVRAVETNAKTKETAAASRDEKNAKDEKAASARTADDELLAALGALYPQRGLTLALSAGYLNTGEQGPLLKISMQTERAAFGFDPAGGGDQKALVDVAGAALDDRGQFGSFKQLLTVTPDSSSDARGQLVVWHQQLRLKPGLYQVRVALRERATGRTGSAMQWVLIPDLSKGSFALSSLFLGERRADDDSAATADTVGPRAVMVDVDHRFARASVLRFQTYIYNAAPGPQGPDVWVQAQVLRGNRPLMTTSPNRVPTTADLARLPFWSEIALDKLPPGRYVLQVTATDRTTNRTAHERVNFAVE